MQPVRKKSNPNKVNLAIDSAIFLAFLLTMAPRFSGIAIHEWLSIAFGAAIITHLLLHWTWLIEVTKRFFKNAQWATRVNYVLNALLFIDITVVIFTGLMISEAALPLIGIRVAPTGSWRMLHEVSANGSIFLVGLHIALHWQWIMHTGKRYVILPLMPRRAARLTIDVNQTQNEA